ncbi:permease [Enterovirga aerilata]|uniref:Permease n=1 Tax=Enterovirga aerilata TaxID=2730920 RepID=A0A849I8B0_9HYPH|nr:permease [Enterovirga sp. DB1703]NNM73561.1 permease [Enterovirga sp. DB1703]
MSLGSLAWFARHELRLAWRDAAAILFGGSLRRRIAGAAILFLLIAFVHALAFSLVSAALRGGIGPDPRTLTFLTGSALLAWCLLLSQAIESVTRAFYARGDMDLILASPMPAAGLFAVRIAGIGAGASAMAMLLATPVIDILVLLDGPRWLLAYLALAALGLLAAAVAVAVTASLFRLLGPARTRFVAQVVAAVIGAAFAISVQAAAILSFDDPSRLAVLSSEWLVSHAPASDSSLWIPARALLGEPGSLALLIAGSLGLLAAVLGIVAPHFASDAATAAGAIAAAPKHGEARARFRRRSPARILREKEWTLLRRDPWLISQTLMQILYLLPAALLLWRSFGEGGNGLAVLVPVLVMASGQLAGGLAWLAVSGEDAPDLVRTAPVAPSQIVRAKIEAVLGAVGIAVAPIIVVVSALSLEIALVAAGGIAVAAASATAIQLWFRAQARRSQFRRRQTSSRIATFAEAFSSILWACAAAFAAQGIWPVAVLTGAVCALALLAVRAMSPRAAA